MYVHASTGLVFLANPRTASRATAKALMDRGFEFVGSHHSGVPFGRLIPISTPFPIFFCTVRNLDHTLRSWARHLGESEGAAGDVLSIVLRKQLPIIEGWESWTLFPHVVHADHILHYENLEPELNQLLQEHGIEPVRLERIG